ncbi:MULTISPECIES: hypothetical protein [Burkholderia cepacia complex]|uniref:hypothetical protein n=1 Tax=Burkholderia stagnalis TaxID=1503054 RepID=UPI0013E0322D
MSERALHDFERDAGRQHLGADRVPECSKRETSTVYERSVTNAMMEIEGHE